MGQTWSTLARTRHGEHDDVEQVLREAMAIERCQLLLRRWERQWCVPGSMLAMRPRVPWHEQRVQVVIAACRE